MPTLEYLLGGGARRESGVTVPEEMSESGWESVVLGRGAGGWGYSRGVGGG